MTRGLGVRPTGEGYLSQDLGYISELMANNRTYRVFPIACLQLWIVPPLALGQARVFFDEKGRAVGYITWAFLSKEVADRWVNDPRFILHLSEWNEGGDLWIMDFFAVPGFAKIVFNEVRKEMFSDEKFAFSVRKSSPIGSRRVIRWRR